MTPRGKHSEIKDVLTTPEDVVGSAVQHSRGQQTLLHYPASPGRGYRVIYGNHGVQCERVSSVGDVLHSQREFKMW